MARFHRLKCGTPSSARAPGFPGTVDVSLRDAFDREGVSRADAPWTRELHHLPFVARGWWCIDRIRTLNGAGNFESLGGAE